MYPNLNAEMARKKILQKNVASFLEMNESTLSLKMLGKVDFFLGECRAIQEHFFPKLTIDYLFETEQKIKEREDE